VVTFVDLTDLRRLEEIRRDFVANASHELKTPLTSIRGYTETLLAGGLPVSEQGQFLATIARNAERLQRIVDDLLDLSRLESGRWQPELARVRVGEVAEASWQAFGEQARKRGVAWSIETDHAPATADRRGLDQVFTNLYDNALRYTPEGGRIRVRIRTGAPPPATGPRRVPADPTGWIVTEVADTGTGIPRDALPRIFERFYRVDPARSRAEGGTGLGLSIVKHMVESMGGSVAAESELGKGTTIRMWLPAAPAA
jgi:two-component system phosphate regulon sensor histidine kinase PhoR